MHYAASMSKPPAGAGVIGRNLRALRRARGWTQHGLASAAGVSRATIAAVELGRYRSVDSRTVDKLAAALGIAAARLWAQEGPGVTEAPSTPNATEAPSTPNATEAPSTPNATEAPSTPEDATQNAAATHVAGSPQQPSPPRSAPPAPHVTEFATSRWYAAVRTTDAEFRWLEQLPPKVWQGVEVTAQAAAELIAWRRRHQQPTAATAQTSSHGGALHGD